MTPPAELNDLVVFDGLLSLHYRRDWVSGVVIDHLAVSSSGVFVIGVLGGGTNAKLAADLRLQVELVRAALADPEVRVVPVLVLTDGRPPLLGPRDPAGVTTVGAKGLAKLLRQPGELSDLRQHEVHARLARMLS